MKRSGVAVLQTLLLVSVIFLSACEGRRSSVVRLATTTSVQESGLLEVLLPLFERLSGYRVYVIAVGSGKAMKYGENGEVDALLTHDPDAEERFLQGGFGVNRCRVMHNDFVVVGPQEDPAGIRGEKDVVLALKRVAAAGCAFISRGDESGTHVRERRLWESAGVVPRGRWYISAGQGMGAVLIMADEKRAYTLTDRATYLAQQGKISLVILCEGDEKLLNVYSVMAVNPEKYRHINFSGANALIDWFVSPQCQRVIGEYKRQGSLLFIPDAGGR